MHTLVAVTHIVLGVLVVFALFQGSQGAPDTAVPPTQSPTAAASPVSAVWRVDQKRCYYTTGAMIVTTVSHLIFGRA